MFVCCFISSLLKERYRQTKESHKDLLPTYQYFKKGRDLYSMLLYGQHQSEVNSHFDGCPLKIPCATDAEVFVSLLRVTALFFFIAELWPQTDSPPYHHTPRWSVEHAGWLAPSLEPGTPIKHTLRLILYQESHLKWLPNIKTLKKNHQDIFIHLLLYLLYTQVRVCLWNLCRDSVFSDI